MKDADLRGYAQFDIRPVSIFDERQVKDSNPERRGHNPTDQSLGQLNTAYNFWSSHPSFITANPVRPLVEQIFFLDFSSFPSLSLSVNTFPALSSVETCKQRRGGVTRAACSSVAQQSLGIGGDKWGRTRSRGNVIRADEQQQMGPNKSEEFNQKGIKRNERKSGNQRMIHK